ncbi:hypothetical protein MMC19_004801 [Ptychographa xylographoides]|nr:hypothetical protein [Ptychographa xylographoides]
MIVPEAPVYPGAAAQQGATRAVNTENAAIHEGRHIPLQPQRIVVEKLTKNVNEDHLREIFGSYGTIREVELPMNRQTMTNRGTAYILYASPTHSESAIAHMHEAQLDGALAEACLPLRIEIVTCDHHLVCTQLQPTVRLLGVTVRHRRDVEIMVATVEEEEAEIRIRIGRARGRGVEALEVGPGL